MSLAWVSSSPTGQGFSLNAIVSYIAEDRVDNALAVLDWLEAPAESLSQQTEHGRIVPKLRAADACTSEGRYFAQRGQGAQKRAARPFRTVLAPARGGRHRTYFLP
jgi:hypothetical protein